jgi:hypothetical protein
MRAGPLFGRNDGPHSTAILPFCSTAGTVVPDSRARGTVSIHLWLPSVIQEVFEMSGPDEWFWVQAARLFTMAGEARERGVPALADLLTEGARQCLDRLAERETIATDLTCPSERFH